MSPNSDQLEKVTVDYSALSSQATKVGLQVGVLMLGIVLISVFGGLWLDRLFGTKPLLTIILVIASAPISLGLTVWVAKRAVNKKTPPAAKGRDSKPVEGDTTGE
jgi:F0F1-type ATP synthase assembly protein I